MIVTLTANPSIDRTGELSEALTRGEVHRFVTVSGEAGGKGVNVSRALAIAGEPTLAILPAGAGDPLLGLLDRSPVPYQAVEISALTRSNLSVVEPDGTTTKLNEPGPRLRPGEREALEAAARAAAQGADWVVLAGSLPPGVPVGWYAGLVRMLRGAGVRTAVDTSDTPLRTLAAGWPEAAPDLIKPNATELAQLCGLNPARVEAMAGAGAYAEIESLCQGLVSRGVATILVSLGAAGAVLVTPTGSWYATADPVAVRSTVGAGDAMLSGYLLAERGGADPPECLRRAVAYGTAAVMLPGSTMPAPDHARGIAVRVRPI